MLKKSFPLLAICLLAFTSASFSQKFMQSAGSTVSVLFGKVDNGYGYKENLTLTQTNVTYFPRFNFIETGNTSVSIGAPIGIGVGFISDYSYYSDNTGVYFAYDLPAVLDFNFGAKSTRESSSKAGGYVGAGFGYYKVSISDSYYTNFDGATYGPLFRGGARFSFGEKMGNLGMSIGLFYKKGMDKNKLNTIGMNLLFEF